MKKGSVRVFCQFFCECPSLTPVLREFPCKLFHTTGNCVNGDECMFSHDALNEDTQDLLDKVGLAYFLGTLSNVLVLNECPGSIQIQNAVKLFNLNNTKELYWHDHFKHSTVKACRTGQQQN